MRTATRLLVNLTEEEDELAAVLPRGRPICRLKLAPLVSVVIPCYNSARYLGETIESVLAQTYARVEVIVVDDGSTDATPKIAQSYPVQYVYQTNRGISAARNAGVVHSRGKYVQFLDHDDRLLPDGD